MLVEFGACQNGEFKNLRIILKIKAPFRGQPVDIKSTSLMMGALCLPAPMLLA
ncbi:hypothetical protein HHE02_06570 [Helicobacter heilmannii]|uniref:Uncharacterized protein n=1 Tax=Helicobacter heilmannii TaxID=35817 RepID=A0A0K2XWV2_HELHE|nr:hypothetical protein BN341_4720 [Helicobacter heilmannii ASB1.4]CRF46708.1 hypothetical protein HHE014_17320 [Helicobacter heilmannii]CRF47369.1 hypothetical protein HHE02_06570 [Helicobacter heilmannii]CRF49969.1 hypothetical protein HHE03_16580 [Helicobacter heilmannii]CRF50516.1 hypothetical protein HHE06_03490 [Helicobacter heilmannii]